jgi:hypothetical protein
MDLETNATKGLAVENSLMLEHGAVAEDATIKIDYVEVYRRVIAAG